MRTEKKKNYNRTRGNHVFRGIHFEHHRDTNRPTCCRMSRKL